MKCRSCDVILSSFEATRKYKSTGEYVDLCNRCFSSIGHEVKTKVRKDLIDRDDDIDPDDESND